MQHYTLRWQLQHELFQNNGLPYRVNDPPASLFNLLQAAVPPEEKGLTTPVRALYEAARFHPIISGCRG